MSGGPGSLALEWKLSPWLGAVRRNGTGWLSVAAPLIVESQEQLCHFNCILNEFQE